MARGKMAARAANQRAQDAAGELQEARAEVARLRIAMGAAEVKHRAELQRRSYDHLAHLDELVEQRLAAAVEQHCATHERQVRIKVLREIGAAIRSSPAERDARMRAVLADTMAMASGSDNS